MKIKMLQDWPAQSPDMNTIEHMWGRMKEGAWKIKPKNIDELWEARLLSLLFPRTSSINCMNPCPTAWIQSFKLMESHSTTTSFADIFLCLQKICSIFYRRQNLFISVH